MKRLYAPWRSAYTRSIERTKDDSAQCHECVFCQQLSSQNDTSHFILGRYQHTCAILNLYPYNAGHILLVPYSHTAELFLLTQEERGELIELASITQEILINALEAQGLNVGINQGKAAGAGIPSHLHMHVLPRWIGDTNFLPLLADTKQISTNLHELYQQLLPFFKEINFQIKNQEEKNHEK